MRFQISCRSDRRLLETRRLSGIKVDAQDKPKTAKCPTLVLFTFGVGHLFL